MKYPYSEFNRESRNIVALLRRDHNAIVTYTSDVDLDSVIEYLKERGYPVNPRESTQYINPRMIDSFLHGDTLRERIREPKKWD